MSNASPAVSCFLLFEIIFVCKPLALFNLAFLLLEQLANVPNDYLHSGKEKLIVGSVLDNKIQQTQDTVLNASMYQSQRFFLKASW